ncbi:MAG: hypothetical protein LUE26_11105 [Alistipes sp.]|nr:hypothetical protein [Alistipes sp.]
MKKRVIILGFTLTLPFSLFAQEVANDDEVKFGIIQLPHLYQREVRVDEFDGISTQGVIDNIPAAWIRVNSEGLFHTPDKPEPAPAASCLQPWDSLYYTTRNYLTFYFDESIFKKADTIRVSDVHEHIYDRAGRIRGTFINGIKEGIWEKFSTGYLEGEHKYTKVIEESYKDGVLNGRRTVYDLNGQWIGQALFVNGTGMYDDYYYDIGKRAVAGFMVYGKRHGWWRYYNKEGVIIREEYYKHGLLHGPFIVYDSSGTIIYETHFVNGTGEYRQYRNNVLKERGQLVDGLRVGEWAETRTGSNSLTPGNDPGIHNWEVKRSYTEQSPINDSGNIIDIMFHDGDYLYLRAKRSE